MNITLSSEEQAIQEYYDKIPYHNFEHALKVTETAMVIAEKIKNILYLTVDEIDLLRKAALWHDAWYQTDSKELFFKTKEDYSIYLMKQFYKNSLSKENIANIGTIIQATKIDFTSYTNHLQKILKASDISNVWGDYDEFEETTRKIKEEYDILHDTKIDATIFLKKQMEILSQFLHHKDTLKEFYFQKEHFDFYKNLAENIQKMQKKYQLWKIDTK